MKDIVLMLDAELTINMVNNIIEDVPALKNNNITSKNVIQKIILTKCLRELIEDIVCVRVFTATENSILLDNIIMNRTYPLYNTLYRELEFLYSSILFKNIDSNITLDIIKMRDTLILYTARELNV